VLLSKALRGASREGALSPRLFAPWFVVATKKKGNIAMKTTKVLFGILTITLALSAQVQAQYSYTTNADDTLTIPITPGRAGLWTFQPPSTACPSPASDTLRSMTAPI